MSRNKFNERQERSKNRKIRGPSSSSKKNVFMLNDILNKALEEALEELCETQGAKELFNELNDALENELQSMFHNSCNCCDCNQVSNSDQNTSIKESYCNKELKNALESGDFIVAEQENGTYVILVGVKDKGMIDETRVTDYRIEVIIHDEGNNCNRDCLNSKKHHTVNKDDLDGFKAFLQDTGMNTTDMTEEDLKKLYKELEAEYKELETEGDWF